MLKCPYCGSPARLASPKEVYKHYNKKGNVWVCSNYPKCDAYVGCHPNTDIPLGRLANSKLRELKKEAHKQFDPLWKSGLMTRNEAYEWLAYMLHITESECHIGMFDEATCNKVIKLCKKQDNEKIREYRREHGLEEAPVFTRGYRKSKK